jgi:PAS domain S-box-containing protein
MNVTAFHKLVDSMHDAVFVVGKPERTIVYANQAAADTFGYRLDELIGQPTQMLHVDADHARQFHELSTAQLSKGPHFQGEFRMRRRSGEVFPTLHSVSLFEDDHGDPCAVSVVRDISVLVDQRETIRESETRLRQLAENLREVFWITSPDKSVLEYVSPAYESVFGRSAEELYKNPYSFLDSVVTKDRERVEHAVLRQAEGDYDIQYQIRRGDGEVRWIHDQCVPVRDEHGEVYRLVGVAEDITRLKRQEMALRQAQKMEAVGRLTGGIAHDFNNMLTVILGNTELLREQLHGQPKETRELVDRVLSAGQRAANLTGRLMTFSRVSPFECVQVDVNAAIGETRSLLDKTLGDNVEILLELDPNLWPVCCDRSQFEASLVNIAINARDAMPDGGRLVIRTINKSLGADNTIKPLTLGPGDYVLIEVEDNGIGIAPEAIGRVFEPFFTTKEVGKGTGLGLSMVFGIMQEFGGTIEVDSTPGEGSCFRIFLPRHAEQGGDAEKEQSSSASERGTLLVVDDEPMLLNLLGRQLRSLGYGTIEHSRAGPALAELERNRGIRMLISDIQLKSDMDGTQLASRARASRPDLPVLLTTGLGDSQHLLQVARSEGFRVLSKPFSGQALESALSDTLQPSPSQPKA